MGTDVERFLKPNRCPCAGTGLTTVRASQKTLIHFPFKFKSKLKPFSLHKNTCWGVEVHYYTQQTWLSAGRSGKSFFPVAPRAWHREPGWEMARGCSQHGSGRAALA